MFSSLKSKLIFATSLLVVVLLSLLATVFVIDKKHELVQKIYSSSLAFAELSASEIAKLNDSYLQQGSFLSFNKEIHSFFQKNSDLKSIRIISYEGTLFYDSDIDKTQIYEGPKRIISDKALLNRIKSRDLSVMLENGKIFFLKFLDNGDLRYFDEDGQESQLNVDIPVIDIMIPTSANVSVEYIISYDSLDSQIKAMLFKTFWVILFGLGVGIFLSYIIASKIVKPISVLTEGALTIAQGDFKKQVNIVTHDEISVLAKAFNQMARKLDESTKAMIFKERLAKEFELAADIQRQILPKEIPDVRGIDIAAGLIPAEAIGGDLFDFIKVDEDNMMFYIGDVTGHGIPSSLVVSIANAVVYSHKDAKSMIEMLTRANSVLKAKTLPNMFLTLLMMNWNINAKKMTYVSAGHEQIVYYSAKDKKVSLLPAGGIALGMLPDISKILKIQEAVMDVGDVMVTYTDGIPECWKDEKQMYGIDKLQKTVAQMADLPSSEAIKNAILADVKMFANGYEQKDDITILVVRRV